MNTVVIIVGLIAVALVAYFVLGVGNPSTPQLGSQGVGGTTYDYSTTIVPPASVDTSSSPTGAQLNAMYPSNPSNFLASHTAQTQTPYSGNIPPNATPFSGPPKGLPPQYIHGF